MAFSLSYNNLTKDVLRAFAKHSGFFFHENWVVLDLTERMGKNKNHVREIWMSFQRGVFIRASCLHLTKL